MAECYRILFDAIQCLAYAELYSSIRHTRRDSVSILRSPPMTTVVNTFCLCVRDFECNRELMCNTKTVDSKKDRSNEGRQRPVKQAQPHGRVLGEYG